MKTLFTFFLNMLYENRKRRYETAYKNRDHERLAKEGQDWYLYGV